MARQSSCMLQGCFLRNSSILSCVLLLGIGSVGLGGCVSYETMKAVKGRPLSSQAIQQIEIGKTSRSDIFRLLGTPHSIFEGQAEFQEAQQVGYYSHRESRTLSSLGDGQYALLYRFGATSDRTLGASAVVVSYRSQTIQLHTNELLILVDKRTNIVSDVAYRKETN